MTPEEELTRDQRTATALMLHALHNDNDAMAELVGQLDHRALLGVVRILAIYAAAGELRDFEEPDTLDYVLRTQLQHLAALDTGEAP
ncbi:hypothetical protein [Streptomyces sp. NPDC001759]